MKKLHVLAAAFMGSSTLLAAPAAVAGDFNQCRAQAEEDCALFWPVGSFQYATCVINLTNACLEFSHGASGQGLELMARPVGEAASQSCTA